MRMVVLSMVVLLLFSRRRSSHMMDAGAANTPVHGEGDVAGLTTSASATDVNGRHGRPDSAAQVLELRGAARVLLLLGAAVAWHPGLDSSVVVVE